MSISRFRILFAVLALCSLLHADEFVRRDGTRLVLNGNEFFFHGSTVKQGDIDWLTEEEVDGEFEKRILPFHSNVVRFWIFGFIPPDLYEGREMELMPSPGVFPEEEWAILDYFVHKAAQENVRIVMTLAGTWAHTPGLPFLVAQIPEAIEELATVRGGTVASEYRSLLASGSTYDLGVKIQDENDVGIFYSNAKCKEVFKEWLEHLVTRTNTYSGRQYKDEPSIMCWELCNEGRNWDWGGETRQEAVNTSVDWYCEMAQYIKSMDPNHLVSTGEDGFLNLTTQWLADAPKQTMTPADLNELAALKGGNYAWYGITNNMWDGQDYYLNTACEHIDIACFHAINDWDAGQAALEWRTKELVEMAHALGKPAYINEYRRPDHKESAAFFPSYKAFYDQMLDIPASGIINYGNINNPAEDVELVSAMSAYADSMVARSGGEVPVLHRASMTAQSDGIEIVSRAGRHILVTIQERVREIGLYSLDGRLAAQAGTHPAAGTVGLKAPCAGTFVLSVITPSGRSVRRVTAAE